MKLLEVIVDAKDKFKARREAAQKARADKVLGRDRNTPAQHLINQWSAELTKIQFFPDEEMGKEVKLTLKPLMKQYGDGKLTVLDALQEGIKAKNGFAQEFVLQHHQKILSALNKQLTLMDEFARRVTEEHPEHNWKRYTRYPQLRIALERQLSFFKALKK